MEILTVSCLQIYLAEADYPKIQVKKGKEVLCTEHLATDGSLKDISFSLQAGRNPRLFRSFRIWQNARLIQSFIWNRSH